MHQYFKFPIEKLYEPVEYLNLERRELKVLRRIKIKTVSQIIAVGKQEILLKRNIGPVTADRIFSAVAEHLGISENVLEHYGIRRVAMLEPSAPSNTTISASELPIVTSLHSALDSVGINPQAWHIVELRAFGLLSIRKLGIAVGGVSEETAYRTLKRTHEKVQNRFSFLVSFCDYLDEQAKLIKAEITTETLSLTTLIEALEHQLCGSAFIATKEELSWLIAIIRSLMLSEQPWGHDQFETKRPDLTFLACLAEPPIQKHAGVNQFLETEKQKRKKVTYPELSYRVLAETKSALHWSELVEKASQLNQKAKLDPHAMKDVLHSHKDLFVRVGPGTYELTEWGSKQVQPFPDLIATVLNQEQQALPLGVIFARVSSIRPIKQTSLEMYLDMHPRFYKAINTMYGLRGWLPPLEKQPPHTPEWLMEEATSAKRVTRAKARGYDVDKLIAQDGLR